MKLLHTLSPYVAGVALSFGLAFAAPTSYTIHFLIINNSSHQVKFDDMTLPSRPNWECISDYPRNINVICKYIDGGTVDGTLHFLVDGSAFVPIPYLRMSIRSKTFFTDNGSAPVQAQLSTTSWPNENAVVKITFTDKASVKK